MFKMVRFHSLDFLLNFLLYSPSFSCSTLGKIRTRLLWVTVPVGGVMCHLRSVLSEQFLKNLPRASKEIASDQEVFTEHLICAKPCGQSEGG